MATVLVSSSFKRGRGLLRLRPWDLVAAPASPPPLSLSPQPSSFLPAFLVQPLQGCCRRAFHGPSSMCCGVAIPLDRLTITYCRSSGPGGQNVNKVNTKAELRFHVDSAEWIPEQVRERLLLQQKHRINRAGELVVASQDHRTQARNREECIAKLEEFLDEAFVQPKIRKIKEGISEHTKAVRREAKRQRSEIKANRRGGGGGWDE